MNPIVLYALQALQAAPLLIAAGRDAAAFLSQSSAAIQKMVAENREPSDAEWDALNAVTADLRKQLHA